MPQTVLIKVADKEFVVGNLERIIRFLSPITPLQEQTTDVPIYTIQSLPQTEDKALLMLNEIRRRRDNETVCRR